MMFLWGFRCLILLIPLVEAARPVAALEKKCPYDSVPNQEGDGCKCGSPTQQFAASRYVANERCTAPGLRVVGFRHEEPEGCECTTGETFAFYGEKLPVEVAAVHFCESTVREADARGYLYWPEEQLQSSGAIELCRGLLANASGQVDQAHPWQSEAAAWKGPKGFGRMQPLEEEAGPADQEAWKEALKNVCHDECVELVNETMANVKVVIEDDMRLGISPARACATRVVQKVEAETFGCCARVCGWNNVTCLSWPFLTKQQQIQWEAECCSEWNVLMGSSRQRLCNSVLSQADVTKASKNDLPEPPNVDTGAVILGQDYTLVWTKKGLQSDLAKKYQSMDPKPEVGKPVDLLILGMDFARSFFQKW